MAAYTIEVRPVLIDENGNVAGFRNPDGSINLLSAVVPTTNANLTGPITSVGNATAIASKTGTGTKFVVDTSPTLVTPVLGVASATSLNFTGGGVTWTNDNTYNIGAVGASRPANLYVGSSINAATAVLTSSVTAASASMTGGGITWVNDNTYNIGAVGANRPANIYVGTAGVFGGSMTVGTGFGCNGQAPQTAYASGGALAAYGAGLNGFDTEAKASALYAMVVAIRAALVANGIMS